MVADWVHTVRAAASAGRLEIQLETVHAVGGDALVCSFLRPEAASCVEPAPPKVLSRYLFGCPDGLQRALMEHGTLGKLATIKGVFLSDLSAAQTGGLVGLRFALADAGAGELSVVGPQASRSSWRPR